MVQQSDNNGNGHGTPGAVEATIPETAPKQGATPAIPPKQKRVYKSSFDRAFTQTEGTNSLKLLGEAGENPIDLLMRTILPSKTTDAYAKVVAFGILLGKCEARGYTRGINQIRNMFGLLPSMDGRSREQLTQAIGGYEDRKQQESGGQSLSSRLREQAFKKGQ